MAETWRSWRGAVVAMGALAVAGCAEHVRSPGATPPAATSRVQAPAAPVPAASSPATRDAPPPRGLAEKRDGLFVVLETPDFDLELAAFEGGAVIVSRSLLAVVVGDAARQDPAWLRGLPGYLNWDARTGAVLPPGTATPSLTKLPRGMLLWTGAGNRHGPADGWRFDGTRWRPDTSKARPELVKLEQAGCTVYDSLELPGGQLVAACAGAEGSETHHFAPGRPTQVHEVPSGKSELGVAQLVDANDALVLCSFAGVWELSAEGWRAVPLPPGGRVERCALDDDGSLWVSDAKHGVLRRNAAGWVHWVLRDGLDPERVWAAGGRAWIAAQSSDGMVLLSTAPVATPLHVKPHHLPHSPSTPGISGLDLITLDVPSVSDTPAGPATRACTSPLLYLGKKLTPALRSRLRQNEETRDLELVRVAGAGPGKLVLGSGSTTRWRRSSGTRSAVAGLLPDFAAGERAWAALADTNLKLLCAKPRVVQRLGRP